MKVVGFTIIRNAVKYDYPVVEAITSVMPLCHKAIEKATFKANAYFAINCIIQNPI